MSTLDGIGFEGLLVLNYDKLTDKKCEEQVIEFVKSNETVSEKDVGFTKMITKVARHIVKSKSGALDGHLERLYTYSMEGFEKSSELRELVDSKSLFTMSAHFLSYAGDFAYTEFEKTGDIEWGIKAFDNRTNSADMVKEIDIEDAGYRYGFVGYTARKLANHTGDNFWFKRMFEGYRVSADILKTKNPRHSARLYEYAALAAKKLFASTEESFWLESWYAHSRKAADMASELKLPITGENYVSAANAARLFSGETVGEKLQWLNRALECYELAFESQSSRKSIHSLYLKVLSGDVAKEIYQITTDVDMARKATNFYHSFMKFYGRVPLKKFKDAAARVKGDMKFLREVVASEKTRKFKFSSYGRRPTQINIF